MLVVAMLVVCDVANEVSQRFFSSLNYYYYFFFLEAKQRRALERGRAVASVVVILAPSAVMKYEWSCPRICKV